MTKIHITRTTIYAFISYYILSYFASIFLIGLMANNLSVPPQSIPFYYVWAFGYFPLTAFIMFLMEAPQSITVLGILSGICVSYILLGYVDFTVNLGDD